MIVEWVGRVLAFHADDPGSSTRNDPRAQLGVIQKQKEK